MALGCGLTSVRDNRGKNYKNQPLVPQKHTKKKKKRLPGSNYVQNMYVVIVQGVYSVPSFYLRQDRK
jgi:hypothetical protein